MSAETAAVLHITSAAGGGADRYVRDIAARSPRRHFALHVGGAIDVLEEVGAHRFTPLRGGRDAPALGSWLGPAGVGIAHLHGIDDACRARLDPLVRTQSLPFVVTLHDLQLLHPRAFEQPGMPEPDIDWIVGLAPTLLRAETVIAPSGFILDVALACAKGVRADVVAPGIDASPATAPPAASAPQDYATHAPPHVVAVVGAIGPHKGSGVLAELVAALAGSGIGIVVIGYTDTQIARGWVVPGGLYVHGPYADHELAGWLAAYRVETVLFPNRLPESFSYTLSEVWRAGVPVVVPDEGALGGRVARHGGGWRLPPGFEGAEAAATLVWLTSDEGAFEHARVKSLIAAGDAARIPTQEAMSREIEALYARFAARAAAPNANAALAALAPLFAANLDGFEFRKELVRFAAELDDARARADGAGARLAEALEWSAKLERDHAEAVAWAGKLEHDTKAWVAKIESDSAAWAGKLEHDTKAWVAKIESDSAAWAAKLEGDIASLKQDIERLGAENRALADPKAAFDLLPEFVRKFLLKRALRARR